MAVHPGMVPASDGDFHAGSPSAKRVQKPALPYSEDPGDLTQEAMPRAYLQLPWKTLKSRMHWATSDRAADPVPAGATERPPPGPELGVRKRHG